MSHAFRVTADDASRFTDNDVVAETALFNTIEEVVWPDDPLTSVEDALLVHRAVPSRVRRTSFRAWAPDGALAGYVNVRIDPEEDDDPEVLQCRIIVGDTCRRQGAGSLLLGQVIEFARSERRTRLIGRSYERIPAGEQFALRLDATAASRTHTNRLELRNVDRALLEKWVADGPIRASGYQLTAWDGAIPQERLEEFVDLMLVMNDAPRDDLERNDFTLTSERWREAEDQNRQQGHERWTLVASTTEGRLVGVHDILWIPTIPGVAFIGSTGVRSEHRGVALGKWLKGAMTLRILDQRPDATEVRTDNADSNAAMLGINNEMGYRPMLGSIMWQAAVEEAARALADRNGGFERPDRESHPEGGPQPDG